MSFIVCTLFENHYHFGVAALTNSLYIHGFRGDVYAGYRGSLPFWTDKSKENPLLEWQGASTLHVTEGLQIHFLPLYNEYHLTNYKPNFMLSLFEGPAKHADGIVYFDPDIIVKCNWKFFETWMSKGVALVHDISSNMPATHPIRSEWEQVISKSGRVTTRHLSSYINGGFCGVAKKNKEFLQAWIDITNIAIKYYKLSPDQWGNSYDRTYPFCNQDQDALNITAMCSVSSISEIGPDGMDFVHGGWTMSHAVGSPKPWKKHYITNAFKGSGPSFVDRLFWLHVQSPIPIYSKKQVSVKLFSIMIAAFISRFYRRS